MQTMVHRGEFELLAIGIRPGEMLLETIKKALAEHDVKNGVVVSGIGTLKSVHLHCITHTRFPSDNHFWREEDVPAELLSVSGIVADGEPHLHVTVSSGEDRCWGGHLEDDSEVLYLAEIAVLKCNALAMTRTQDPERKVSLLGPKEA